MVCIDVNEIYQLKDENGKLMGVDTQNLLIANSGNDLPVRHDHVPQFVECLSLWSIISYMLWQVIDLSSVSQELAYLSSDADLVILEGMVSIN